MKDLLRTKEIGIDAAEVSRRDVLNTLKTLRIMFQQDPVYALEALDSAILELQKGASVVGSDEVSLVGAKAEG